MTCTCVRNVNRQLRIGGTQLETVATRDDRGHAGAPRVLVRTAYIDPTVRRQMPIAVAAHCPFCGTKYED